MICRAVAMSYLLAASAVAAPDFSHLERLVLDDPRAALRESEQALAEATPRHRIEILSLMGRAAGQLGDAGAVAEVVLRLSNEPAPAQAVAQLLRADRQIDLGLREEGLRLALEAAPELADAGPLLRFHAQFLLCLAYFENRRYLDAEQHCEQAEETARSTGNEFALARAEDVHSWATYVRGDATNAIAISERALARARAISAEGLFSVIAGNLAQAYVDVGRHAEALTLSRESLRRSLEGGRIAHAVEARINIGRVFQAEGRDDEALKEIAIALQDAQRAQYLAGLEEVYLTQAQIAEQAGRLDLALAATRGLAEVRLRPAERPTADQLAELEARYQAREQALRIRDLDQEREAAELRLQAAEIAAQRQRGFAWILGTGVIVAIGIAALLGWALRTQRRLSAELEALSMRDPLTGVENRRVFLQRLDRCLQQAASSEGALMILDLDHFKSINDTYGHPFGDTVLLATVAAVREALESRHHFARLGGEEFALLCERGDAASIVALAERLRQAVAVMRVKGPRGEVQLSVSIGVAPRHPGIDQAGIWLHEADQALYAAKHGGRNRVARYEAAMA